MMHDPELELLRARQRQHDIEAELREEILDALHLLLFGAVAGVVVAIMVTAPGWGPWLLRMVMP
jgi:hypothetical protein